MKTKNDIKVKIKIKPRYNINAIYLYILLILLYTNDFIILANLLLIALVITYIINLILGGLYNEK